jgi:glutamate dehydrogenase (NADP+)
MNIEGLKVGVSGFGNVAWGAITKINELGGKVVTISGPDGYVYDPDGIKEKVDYLLELRASNNDVVEPYAHEFNASLCLISDPGRSLWMLPCHVPLKMKLI